MSKYRLNPVRFRSQQGGIDVSFNSGLRIGPGDQTRAVFAYEFEIWLRICVEYEPVDVDPLLALGRALMNGSFWRLSGLKFKTTRIHNGWLVVTVSGGQLDDTDAGNDRRYLETIELCLNYRGVDSIATSWDTIVGLADHAIGNLFTGPLQTLIPFVVCPAVYKFYRDHSYLADALAGALDLKQETSVGPLVEAEAVRRAAMDAAVLCKPRDRRDSRLFVAQVEFPSRPLV